MGPLHLEIKASLHPLRNKGIALGVGIRFLRNSSKDVYHFFYSHMLPKESGCFLFNFCIRKKKKEG
jgi:hypothetical protein